MFTPLDLEEQNGAYRGALYGISFNERLALLRRPMPKAKQPAGLYFTGGTTHPGGGVPLVVLSGKHTASLVMDFLAKQE
jgi:phytoene dehydrogenase-like protein